MKFTGLFPRVCQEQTVSDCVSPLLPAGLCRVPTSQVIGNKLDLPHVCRSSLWSPMGNVQGKKNDLPSNADTIQPSGQINKPSRRPAGRLAILPLMAIFM